MGVLKAGSCGHDWTATLSAIVSNRLCALMSFVRTYVFFLASKLNFWSNQSSTLS